MLEKVKPFLYSLLYKERSIYKLTLSFCIGNFIAFSPFIFLHTIMIFILVWLFRLNFAVTFAAAYGINNPWTAVPIYTLDYFFGHWFVHNLCHINVALWTPTWMTFITTKCEQLIGLKNVCVFSFLVGGHVLSVLISIALFPIMKRIFSQLMLETTVTK